MNSDQLQGRTCAQSTPQMSPESLKGQVAACKSWRLEIVRHIDMRNNFRNGAKSAVHKILKGPNLTERKGNMGIQLLSPGGFAAVPVFPNLPELRLVNMRQN
jgi:hypothetical protein